ncbi:Ran GAP Rna1 [Coemansia sp. RSA 2523]|nr:Ran GAP Rna1 [Coemansia sp. RSA 1824]KAJ1805631.1 Ran GAP Rna1 [Coemansia sp. RSA 2523]KAJ2141905.1 Ran GAP Rna1 [Coemansia sp. RSA 637]KAJ2146422.1 Ran GAP Rna1 [Coemansia sp. RSA 564]KAJ2199592.1 Ran GAP Rna1 [Coemansia sp. RSA 522]KAJ2230921.1 Ran GAP Rna1 [Coemansia sp. RSA 518]KAJ2272701.1 Ran GAP Rna1 [Coemansia sp. RSA 451]KAJ2405309.1 Ran GAP Rna1 [Coemansia sp. RSA 2526]KAJ2435528.1 Ran GAP Rna1 [Coemansia sp. RSA 2522]KAJ2530863.1 Ran GAP Rna1 [Coemansia sp. RSA 1935]KAJ25694
MAIPTDRIYSLEGKGLKLTTAEDIEPYLAELRNVENLEEVRLNGNTLGAEASKALASVLKTKKTLKVATLHDIFTSRLKDEVKESVVAICEALGELPDLVEVNLSDNAFGPLGAESMAPFLARHTKLEVLKLNNNGLGIQGGTTIARALLECHAECEKQGLQPALRTLVCGRNRLENGAAPEFARAFAALKTLREVRMPQNGIRPEGIAELVAGLSHNTELGVLDLQDNTFTASGSQALAVALAKWETLEALNIGDCLLGAEGGRLVIQALKNRHTLKTVNLQYNEIENDGAVALSESLRTLKVLESLELNGNRFDAEGDAVELIKAALSENDLDDDILGSLSDMEELTDDEDEEDESDDEKDEAEQPTSAAKADEQLADLVDEMKKQLSI